MSPTFRYSFSKVFRIMNGIAWKKCDLLEIWFEKSYGWMYQSMVTVSEVGCFITFFEFKEKTIEYFFYKVASGISTLCDINLKNKLVNAIINCNITDFYQKYFHTSLVLNICSVKSIRIKGISCKSIQIVPNKFLSKSKLWISMKWQFLLFHRDWHQLISTSLAFIQVQADAKFLYPKLSFIWPHIPGFAVKILLWLHKYYVLQSKYLLSIHKASVSSDIVDLT